MIIGITGGIGSGKSVIAQQLRKMGYEVYDTDSQAKRLVVEDAHVREQITALFGEEVYKDGVYQTALVAQKVFADKSLLAQLNAIVHPAVKADIGNWVSEPSDSPKGDPTSDSEAIRLLTAKRSNLQHSCFYEIDNALHDAIFVACIVFFFEVVFEEFRHKLPEVGTCFSSVMFDNLIAGSIAFTIHELHEHLSLGSGHATKMVFIFLEEKLLMLSPPFLSEFRVIDSGELGIRMHHFFG